MAAFTPPPWRQRRRGSGFESGAVAGILEPGGLVVDGMMVCGIELSKFEKIKFAAHVQLCALLLTRDAGGETQEPSETVT
jgi:hypothetical protein